MGVKTPIYRWLLYLILFVLLVVDCLSVLNEEIKENEKTEMFKIQRELKTFLW